MISESAARVEPVAKAARAEFVLDMISAVNSMTPDKAIAARTWSFALGREPALYATQVVSVIALIEVVIYNAPCDAR